MRTPVLISTWGFLLALLLESCNFLSSTSSSGGVRATGVAYEIVVVADPALWENRVGNAIKRELLSPVPGLPQSEPSMRITYVKPTQFDGMMKYVRNILIITIDPSQYTKVSFRPETDKWAGGQLVIYAASPDENLLADYMDLHPGALVNYFTKIEMQRTAQMLNKTHSSSVAEKLKNKFGITLHVPSDFTFYRDTTHFFWASNNANRGRMDIAVYSFPYTDKLTFTGDYLIAMRDSVLGANIPGSFPNSHMATDIHNVSYTAGKQNGKYCGILRGLWHMEGDMMGGPFVSYARLDEANNRIIVVEGFVYSPDTDKRVYIRRLEGALHTLRLLDESDVREEVESEDNK